MARQTSRRKPATRPVIMIDGRPARDEEIDGLNTPLAHVHQHLIGQSYLVLYEQGIGLLGQAILSYKKLRKDLNENQLDELDAVLLRHGKLRGDMVVRGWANGSTDMSVASAA